MWQALAHARAGDRHELRALLQLGDGPHPAVAHARAQAADQLVHDVRDLTPIGDDGLNTLRHYLVEALIGCRLRLLALAPSATLRRGYASGQRPGGGVVRSAATVGQGERLTVRFAEDQLSVTADQGTKA